MAGQCHNPIPKSYTYKICYISNTHFNQQSQEIQFPSIKSLKIFHYKHFPSSDELNPLSHAFLFSLSTSWKDKE